MHELALTQSLVDLVMDRTAGRRVSAVHLRVGELSGVVPEAMEFCFDVVTADGPLAGSTLVLQHVPARISCRTCGQESVADDVVPACPCGSADVDVVAGRELDLTHVELLREAPCA